jgi:nucleotide-binding universal stress UspA family protein
MAAMAGMLTALIGNSWSGQDRASTLGQYHPLRGCRKARGIEAQRPFLDAAGNGEHRSYDWPIRRNLPGNPRDPAMNSVAGREPCVIVGISRSHASWWALAWAVGEARRRDARLMVVHACRPSAMSSGTMDYGQCVYGPPQIVHGDNGMAYGHAMIAAAIHQAVGRMPGDMTVDQRAIAGRPAPELARLAQGGDLIVLGSRHRGWLRRFAPGSVARACARRACCPVVIVPEPSPAMLPAALPDTSPRAQRFRWVPRRGQETAS